MSMIPHATILVASVNHLVLLSVIDKEDPETDREVMITPDEARTIAHGLTEAAGYASKHREVGE